MKPAPPQKRCLAVELAADHAAVEGIAAEVGVSTSSVYRWMAAANVKSNRPRRYPPRVRRSALRRLSKGQKPDQVAAALHVHPSTVRLWRQQARGTP